MLWVGDFSFFCSPKNRSDWLLLLCLGRFVLVWTAGLSYELEMLARSE